ncbi:MAG: response regulator [Candidatus Omnitrophica bacterium]|nr:response regulator [Candidatus Omnitrophota bacterium]
MAKKILIADSDPLFLESLVTRIKNGGEREIITVFDGLEALKKAKKEKLGLVILEDSLNFINGFKICRLLKFDKRRRHIPVLLLMSQADEINTALAKEVGADECLPHSVDDELLGKIDSYFTKED